MRITQLYAFQEVSVVKAVEQANAQLQKLVHRDAILRTLQIDHQRSDSIGGTNVVLIVAIEMDDIEQESADATHRPRG